MISAWRSKNYTATLDPTLYHRPNESRVSFQLCFENDMDTHREDDENSKPTGRGGDGHRSDWAADWVDPELGY